ncbi:MAG: hypothetical protein K5924_06495 [Chloroflexi bacterium]|nr:hypothetical protein [Chloroflexota bacterium]
MTEINGLRLAYRGFVAGLAGAYVWAALAMVLAAMTQGDALAPLRPLAAAISPLQLSPELGFVVGLAGVQAAGALVGMTFAYFFGRFFTVRSTVIVAGPAFALLAWGLVAAALAPDSAVTAFATHPIPALASVAYGLLLGAGVPLRGDVTRYAGSPST